MNKSSLPSGETTTHRWAGRGVDGTLFAYFRSEMPNPWPSAPAVQTTHTSKNLSYWLKKSRGRLALAASVALFCTGSWGLSYLFPYAPFVPGGATSKVTMGKGIRVPERIDENTGKTKAGIRDLNNK